MKAESDVNSEFVPVRIIANSLSLDREGQKILPEAFNKETVKHFLEKGIIDWHHQSKMGSDDETRAAAILGSPTKFAWENGLPVVYANLTRKHPYVQQYILPHLEADNPVFSASVGGRTLQVKPIYNMEDRVTEEQISKIMWDHLAVAARPYVMCPGTEMKLVKAMKLQNGDEIGPVIQFNFSDVGVFGREYAIMNHANALFKAMTVGTETDSSHMVGTDAIRKQSLEGRLSKLVPDLNDYMESLREGIIAPTEHDGIVFFIERGMSEDDAKSVIQHLINSVSAFAEMEI